MTGHRVEFLGDWRELAPLQASLGDGDSAYVDLEEWQILAVDDDLRLPLSCEAMAERAAIIRSALDARA